MTGDESRDVSRRGEHTVSPELVLVDPALAEHARGWLHRGDDTLARLERMLAARRIAASRAQHVEHVRASPDVSGQVRRTDMPRGVLRSAVASGAVLVTACALLVGVRIDVDGDPARAESTETTIASPSPGVGAVPSVVAKAGSTKTSKPGLVPNRPKSRPRSEAAAPTGSRRFAWAPVAGASGYHIEFFDGSSLVFSRDSKDPSIALPARWRFDGRSRSLEPGEYRWYVWALVSGKRASQATVRAALVVES